MPTYTETELANRALRKLSVIGEGQTASAADLLLVTDKIEGLLDELASRRVIPGGDVDQLRPADFDHVATVLAAMCCGEFALTGAAAAPFVQLAAEAERKLRIIHGDTPPFSTLEMSYF